MDLDTDALVICKYLLFGSLHIGVHSNTNDDTPPNNEPFYVSLPSCTHTWVYPLRRLQSLDIHLP